MTPDTDVSNRITWDQYFLEMARVASMRSTCFRNKVGAVIVRNHYVVSTGYNGAPHYQPNCGDIGFCYRDKHGILSGTQLENCRAVGSHAESNAVVIAARNGFATEGGTLYLYGHRTVCNQCKAIISNAGIERVLVNDGEGHLQEYIPRRDWTVHPVDQ